MGAHADSCPQDPALPADTSRDAKGRVTHVIELEFGQEGTPTTPISAVVARAEFLNEALGLLLKDLGFGDFCRSLLKAAMKAMPCDAASFIEVDASRNCFFFRASLGASSERIDHFEFPLNLGIAGHVYESRHPAYITHVSDDSHHLKAIAKAVGFDTRNMAAIPVVIRGRVYGIVEFLNRPSDTDFTPQEREGLETLVSDFARILEVRLMIGWALQARAPKAGSGEKAA